MQVKGEQQKLKKLEFIEACAKQERLAINCKNVSSRRTWQDRHGEDKKQTDFLEKAEKAEKSLTQRQRKS